MAKLTQSVENLHPALRMIGAMTDIQVVEHQTTKMPLSHQKLEIYSVRTHDIPHLLFLTIGKSDVLISDRGHVFRALQPATAKTIDIVEAAQRKPDFNPGNIAQSCCNAAVASIIGANVAINHAREMSVFVPLTPNDVLSGCFYMFTIIENLMKFDMQIAETAASEKATV